MFVGKEGPTLSESAMHSRKRKVIT